MSTCSARIQETRRLEELEDDFRLIVSGFNTGKENRAKLFRTVERM